MVKKDYFADRATDWDVDKRIRMADRYVNEVLKHIEIEQHWKALEVGAGTGLVGLKFLPRLSSIVFEDTSDAMLAVLQEKLSRYKIRNAEIVCGETTDYVRKDIDFVISNMAFHHIEDIKSLVAHLFAIARQRAIVAIGDIRAEDGSFHYYKPIPHKGFDTNKLVSVFEESGF
ncbi:MAG: class I SAM-dependent methyltransferase [Paludibacteraceae bacterium]